MNTLTAASKTEVNAGTNITNVGKTQGANGQDIYTVNANGTTATAGSSALTVTAGAKDTNNVTDYAVDLAQSTKDDIKKGADAKDAVDNTGLTFTGDSGTTGIKKLGDTVGVTGDNNITTEATATGVQMKLNPNLAVDSLKAGNSTLDNTGLTIAGGPKFTTAGIDAGTQQINNVAAGTAPTDAVNFGQLQDATQTLTDAGFNISAQSGTADKVKLGETVDYANTDGNVVVKAGVDNQITFDLAKAINVDQVTTGNTIMNNDGIAIGQAVKLDNTGLVIAGGPSVTNKGIDAGNKTISNVAAAVNGTDAVNKDQLDTAITNVNNTVTQVNDQAVKYDKNVDGTINKDKITLEGKDGTTITNVKDGNVAKDSKDAVNGGQLWNVQQQVDTNTSDITNIKNDINNGSVGLVQQAGPQADVTVAKDTGGKTVNVAGKDGERVVTGVANGNVSTTSKDAVNGSQLNQTNQAVVNYLGGGAGYDNITQSFTAPTYNVGGSNYNNVGGAIDALNKADQTLNNKIDNVDQKLNNAFQSTNKRINDVEKAANAGIAAAMALESAPYVPGKYTYAAGAAYHGGENAVGVTLRKTADNGRWSITGGVAAASEGDPSVRIGISGVID